MNLENLTRSDRKSFLLCLAAANRLQRTLLKYVKATQKVIRSTVIWINCLVIGSLLSTLRWASAPLSLFYNTGVKYTPSEKFSLKAKRCFEAIESTLHHRENSTNNAKNSGVPVLPKIKRTSSETTESPKKYGNNAGLSVAVTQPVSDDMRFFRTFCKENESDGYRNCMKIAELFDRSFEHLKNYVAKTQYYVNNYFEVFIERLSNASLLLNKVLTLLDETIDLQPYLARWAKYLNVTHKRLVLSPHKRRQQARRSQKAFC